MQKNGKLGIALVGLGSYASEQLAPALEQTKHCSLAAIVTGTPEKAWKWKSRYNIPEQNIYSYENFDAISDNSNVDIVYIVLPNALHAEFTIRAAEAGKHVICEKPMATTVEDCDRMIEACKKAGRMLSIGYRLHFEPYNLEMKRLGQEKSFGNIRKIKAGYGFPLTDPDEWRVKKSLSGGGPLVDVGIYCIQAFCYTTGTLPFSVSAEEGKKTNQKTFAEVEQSLTWQMEMPGNVICEGFTSYAENMNFLEVEAEGGTFGLNPAFGYSGQAGYTPEGPLKLPHINQQAKQMDDFALAIKENRPTPVPGEMGKRDVILLQAVYAAMTTGKKINIDQDQMK